MSDRSKDADDSPQDDEKERERRIRQAERRRVDETKESESEDLRIGSAIGATETHRSRVGDTGSGRLEVRCPGCHVPMDVAVDTKLTDLTCSACGSHFSLVDHSQATRMAPALTKLGRFELIERLGVGGFGSVWKARDRELDRTVAIKIPRQGVMSPEEQEKFFREARAAAQLRHPGIVSVHEVGRDGESVYIVSDLVRGVTLGDWLTGQQLSNREAAELCAKIADALEHAHEQGVVHRDLKPANIMIDGDGEPHLMDFGLARRDAGEITVTMDGQVLGTPAYMSPEQAAGEGHSADRRSDVYSLGVILFQLLTGELPFRGNARMLVHQVVNDPPPSPRKFNANIRKDAETIVLKCLEKEPDRRYQSAKELADELRRYLSGQPIEARPISRVERGWRWCKRNPAAAALSALLLLALLTISTVAPLVAAHQASLRLEAEAAKEEATHEAAIAKRLADVEGAKYAMTQGRVSEAYQQIASAIKSQPTLEYSRILDDIVDKARADWQLIQRIPIQQSLNWGCFVGPGPRWLVLSHGDTVEARSLLRNQVFATITIPGGGNAARAVSLNKVAIASKSGGFDIYALPKLESVAHCEIGGKVVEIRPNEEGTTLVALNDRGNARVFDATGKMLAETEFQPEGRRNVLQPTIDISPSGKTVLYHAGTDLGKKYIWRWQAKQNQVVSFDSLTFQARLESDDAAIGIRTNITGAVIRRVELSQYLPENFSLNAHEPFLYTDGAILDGVGDEKANVDITSICDDAIHRFDGPRVNYYRPFQLRMRLTRYHSLWPQATQNPKFLAYDTVSHTLALTTDREVIVFAGWLPAINWSDVGTNLKTDSRMLVTAANSVFTCHDRVLESLNFETFAHTVFELTPPDPVQGMHIDVEQIAVTPNASLAAILWHEYPNAGGKIGRMLVQILKLGLPEDKRPVCLREFELKDLVSSSVRESGRLILTPDANVVGTSSVYGIFAGYRVDDGTQLYKHEISTTTAFAICADPPMLAVGDYKIPTDVQVFDVRTGRTICQIPRQVPVERFAFSADGQFIYLSGLKDKVIEKYRVSDGTLLTKTESPAMPVAISPSGSRFVGFFADAPRVGSLVLGDLTTGKIAEHISDNAFILDRACFSPDENTIVYNIASNQCAVLRSPVLADAEKRLEQSAINSELAGTADDLLDYRERLAKSLHPDKPGHKKFDSQDEQQTRLAFDIWENLMADYPRIAKYREALANLHEVIALDSEEELREANRSRQDLSNQQQLQRAEQRQQIGPQIQEHLKKAFALRKKLAADFPQTASYEESLATTKKLLEKFNVPSTEISDESDPSVLRSFLEQLQPSR